jgi:hypothetical protein
MEKIRKMFGDSLVDEWGEQLLCPVCSDYYTHIEKVEHYPDHDDYYCKNIPSIDWEGRGEAVVLHFYCESNHKWAIRFGFHKGNIYVKKIIEK